MGYKFLWFFQTLFVRLLVKKIGWISYVGSPTFIYGGKKISIGNRVRIFPGARMETHKNGEIIIENNVSIGQNLHLISLGQKLIIHEDTTISGNVFITNVDHDYSKIGVHILKQDYISKATEIGKNCFIGYGAVIQAGTILGKQCVVGSNSVVRGVFPDYSIIVGSPAKAVKQFDTETNTWCKITKKEID
jgi:acetyltransferase-like isoleucine patch superfamily enzyme